MRQAALIAGFAYLLMPVAFAEFSLWPKLVIPGNIEQTVQNIVAHGGLFVAAILCYLLTLILDGAARAATTTDAHGRERLVYELTPVLYARTQRSGVA